MSPKSDAQLHQDLLQKKQELMTRLEKISANLQRGFNADSKEMAKELEDAEVVDALGNEARSEIAQISAALKRMDDGTFGFCVKCAERIDRERLSVHPFADDCIDCARDDESRLRA